MRRRVAVVGALVAGIAALSAWWTWSGRADALPPIEERPLLAPTGERPPDVVLVLACTLRRDALTPYGADADASPFLARVAAEGVRFDDVVATSSWTKASTIGLLTGRDALSLDMVEPGTGRNERVLPAGVTTLAERLAAVGYETFGVTGNPNLDTSFGLAQGFDGYADPDARIRDRKLSGHELVARALALVDGRRAPDRPLFLQLMLVDAHEPRSATREERAPFDGGPVLETYLAEVRRLDDAVAALVDGLAARGIADPLLVVVADHGEGLDTAPGHHGHGRTLYESITRVPWLIRGPGVARGHVVAGLASGLDLTPTILGLVGLPSAMPGRDWSALARGEGDRTDRGRAFADTWFYEVQRSAIFTPEEACAFDFGSSADEDRDARFRPGCFDRRRDPDWLRPTSRPALEAELARWREARLAERDGVDAVGSAAVDPETRAQLEALGYAE